MTSIELKDRIISCDITLKPFDNERLLCLCGQTDENIRHIERRLEVEILNRGNAFKINGADKTIEQAKQVLEDLYKQTTDGKELTPDQVHLSLQQIIETSAKTKSRSKPRASRNKTKVREFNLNTSKGKMRPRSKTQEEYIDKILNHALTFAIGPAGTGKTFLSVACAAYALQQQQVRRIVLVRPVVEAGEHLGFLPGDLTQKIDPYLRPLYDSLYDILGQDKVLRLIEQEIIEIAPLAYMRGRTLNDAFIILDEGQNTTKSQMQMFLTRIGFSSTVVITGDITQIDLDDRNQSGLLDAKQILKNIPEICFVNFSEADVVRHPIVKKIITAYAKNNKGNYEH